MINKMFFEEKMREALLLLNSKMKAETVNLIYERVKDSYNEEDLALATEAVVGDEGPLNYTSLVRKLDYCRSVRVEREAQEAKQRREEEEKRFWKANYRDGACSRKCYECPAVYCNAIANEAIKAIKAILSGEKTVEEADRELAEKFPGAGFETTLPDLHPF